MRLQSAKGEFTVSQARIDQNDIHHAVEIVKAAVGNCGGAALDNPKQVCTLIAETAQMIATLRSGLTQRGNE